MRGTLTLVLLCIMPLLGGWPHAGLGGGGNSGASAGGGGGPTLVVDDPFTDDITDWVSADGTTSNISHDATNDELDNSERAHMVLFEGTNVANANSWCALVFGTETNSWKWTGCGLRHKGSDQTSTEYHYVARFEDDTAGQARIRVCDGDDFDQDCENVVTLTSITGTTQVANGDMLRFAVEGTGSGTEFALWWVDSASSPDPTTTTFGTADHCVSSDGTISETELSSYCDCPTNCSSWDTSPDAATGKDFPAGTQTEAAIYFPTSNSRAVTYFTAGAL